MRDGLSNEQIARAAERVDAQRAREERARNDAKHAEVALQLTDKLAEALDICKNGLPTIIADRVAGALKETLLYRFWILHELEQEERTHG